MTISKSLKKLFKTITGSDAKSNTAGDIINELNDNYPSGGSGDFEVTYTLNNSSSTWECSEEFDTILQAIEDKKNILCYIVPNSAVPTVKAVAVLNAHANVEAVNSAAFGFTSISYDLDTNKVVCMTIEHAKISGTVSIHGQIKNITTTS